MNNRRFALFIKRTTVIYTFMQSYLVRIGKTLTAFAFVDIEAFWAGTKVHFIFYIDFFHVLGVSISSGSSFVISACSHLIYCLNELEKVYERRDFADFFFILELSSVLYKNVYNFISFVIACYLYFYISFIYIFTNFYFLHVVSFCYVWFRIYIKDTRASFYVVPLFISFNSFYNWFSLLVLLRFLLFLLPSCLWLDLSLSICSLFFYSYYIRKVLGFVFLSPCCVAFSLTHSIYLHHDIRRYTNTKMNKYIDRWIA